MTFIRNLTILACSLLTVAPIYNQLAFADTTSPNGGNRITFVETGTDPSTGKTANSIITTGQIEAVIFHATNVEHSNTLEFHVPATTETANPLVVPRFIGKEKDNGSEIPVPLEDCDKSRSIRPDRSKYECAAHKLLVPLCINFSNFEDATIFKEKFENNKNRYVINGPQFAGTNPNLNTYLCDGHYIDNYKTTTITDLSNNKTVPIQKFIDELKQVKPTPGIYQGRNTKTVPSAPVNMQNNAPGTSNGPGH